MPVDARAEGARRPVVVVLGGGFAGVGAARKLKEADVDVVLVDKHDYHTFQPLLYQLATGLLETTAVGHSLRDLVHDQDNVTIHKAPVTGDRPRRDARCGSTEMAPLDVRLPRARARRARSTSSGPRAPPSTPSRCTRSPDAVRLKDHVLERWEAADKDTEPRSTTAR